MTFVILRSIRYQGIIDCGTVFPQLCHLGNGAWYRHHTRYRHLLIIFGHPALWHSIAQYRTAQHQHLTPTLGLRLLCLPLATRQCRVLTCWPLCPIYWSNCPLHVSALSGFLVVPYHPGVWGRLIHAALPFASLQRSADRGVFRVRLSGEGPERLRGAPYARQEEKRPHHQGQSRTPHFIFLFVSFSSHLLS